MNIIHSKTKLDVHKNYMAVLQDKVLLQIYMF